MLTASAEGYKAKLDNQTYLALIDKQKKEIDRKEAVIVAQINKNKICYSALDTISAAMRVKDDIIAVQENTIKKQGRVKKLGIGVMGGYGLAIMQKPMMQPFVGFGIYYSLARF